jgi:endonuclease YncB( thermonuclease family)
MSSKNFFPDALRQILHRKIKVGLILLPFAFLALGCGSAEQNTSAPYDCHTSLCCSNCEVVEVHKIIDGDTFKSSKGTIRLFGADAPEIGHKCYDTARTFLQNLSGDQVRIESGPRSRDRFERTLFYVYDINGQSVSELLISAGLAEAWRKDGQHRKTLIFMQNTAREQRIGCLWE